MRVMNYTVEDAEQIDQEIEILKDVNQDFISPMKYCLYEIRKRDGKNIGTRVYLF